MSFVDQVRELGGDEADLELLKDVASDEEYYETQDAPRDEALAGDVASMWAELQGKPKKIVFGDDGAAKPVREGQNGTKPKKEPKKEPKEPKEPTEEHRTKNKQKDERKPSERKPKDAKAREQPAVPAQPSKALASINHTGKLMLEDVDLWDLAPSTGKPLPSDQIPFYKRKAEDLLRQENDRYQDRMKTDPDYKAQAQFLRSGTFGDQLGTLSLIATPSPLHNIKALESLLDKCEIKNRESACKALEVTKDLLVSHVLPDRRLKQFKDQPLTLNASPENLIAWAFEDWLKDYFFKLLQIMERLLSDSVENIRLRTLHVLFGFFESKPEQELNLLRLGINKLGDSSGKVASRVKKLLLDTFNTHPAIKPIAATIINETIERSSEYRTRYYAVDTLSEFILSSKDPKLANQLLYIYLNLFERLLAEWDTKKDEKEEKAPQEGKKGRNKKRGKKGGLVQQQKTASQLEDEQNARLVSKIFSGLNRAFPFSQMEASAFTKYMDTLYKMSHSPNAATYIEALCFIYQLANAQRGQGLDRYYRALYESLLDQRLFQSSKIAKYLNLLLKSVVKDEYSPRSAAFAKRLTQMAVQWPDVGAVASLAHIVNYIPGVPDMLGSEQTAKDVYDLKARDPKFAKAETTKLWELLPLLNHYHPTVTVYADNILREDKQTLDMPDIEQHSVSSFLTKWSYKKPKEKDTSRGGSMFQPLSGYTDLTLGIRQEQKNNREDPISVQDWTNRKLEDIRPDERFFYEYFKEKPRPVKVTAEDEDSDLEETEIFDAIMKSNPDEMPSDIDSDGDLDGLAEEMGSDGSEDLDLDDDLDDSDGELPSDEEESDEPADEDEDEDDEGGAEFAEFSDSGEDEEAAEAKPKSKRKREWQELPTFMDADAYEEYTKRPKS